jgi:hypothetical protein
MKNLLLPQYSRKSKISMLELCGNGKKALASSEKLFASKAVSIRAFCLDTCPQPLSMSKEKLKLLINKGKVEDVIKGEPTAAYDIVNFQMSTGGFTAEQRMLIFNEVARCTSDGGMLMFSSNLPFYNTDENYLFTKKLLDETRLHISRHFNILRLVQTDFSGQFVRNTKHKSFLDAVKCAFGIRADIDALFSHFSAFTPKSVSTPKKAGYTMTMAFAIKQSAE